MTPDSTTDAQIAKAKVRETSRLLKSDKARSWLAKRQKNRTEEVGNGLYRLRGRAYDGSAGPGELAKADGRIKTIYDMVDLHYGFIPEFLGGGKGSNVSKADDYVTSGTTGVENVVYGQEVFSLLNSESNVYSLLEKRPWRRSGERLIKSHGHTLGSGGVEENAGLPDTDFPELDTFEQDPRNVAHTFSVSQVEQLLADTQDDHFADNPMEFGRRWYGTGTEHQSGQGEHPKHINVQLTANAEGGVGSNDFRSIDQLISSGDEEDNVAALSDGDADVYGFDRTNDGFFDANVNHNSGTNRNLTIDILDDGITSIREASGKDPVADGSYFFLTNHDAFQIIEEEVAAKERLEPQRVSVGMNGVQTQPGDDVGLTVQSYKDIPIFRSNDIAEDGTGRVYLIDSSTMFIKQLLPTQYYDTGIETDSNPFSLDRLGDEGMFLTIGELICTNPKAQWKARDLE